MDEFVLVSVLKSAIEEILILSRLSEITRPTGHEPECCLGSR